MPSILCALTCLFAALGPTVILLVVLPSDGWRDNNGPIAYAELWRSGAIIGLVAVGIAMILLARAFYKAQRWVRYVIPLGFTSLTIYCALEPDPSFRGDWTGALFWAVLSYLYLNRKSSVTKYFSASRTSEIAYSGN